MDLGLLAVRTAAKRVIQSALPHHPLAQETAQCYPAKIGWSLTQTVRNPSRCRENSS